MGECRVPERCRAVQLDFPHLVPATLVAFRLSQPIIVRARRKITKEPEVDRMENARGPLRAPLCS